MFEESDLIHRYTRAEALRDGVLIDVSQTARDAGFRYPVALTAAAWARTFLGRDHPVQAAGLPPPPLYTGRRGRQARAASRTARGKTQSRSSSATG